MSNKLGEGGKKKFYTIEATAKAWDVSVCTVYRRIKAGHLPIVKIGRLTRIRQEHVENPPQGVI